MACSAQQTFSVSGGCPPYTWSATTGSITQDGVYTAPASNAGCASNPTITVTDCCGGSDDIQIAVNCYTSNNVAFHGITFIISSILALCNTSPPLLTCGDYGNACDGPGHYFIAPCCMRVNQYPYNCAGTYLGCVEDCYGGKTCWMTSMASPGCPGSATFANYCPPGGYDTFNDGEYRDYRTAAMKEAGCCPINPATGLPF